MGGLDNKDGETDGTVDGDKDGESDGTADGDKDGESEEDEFGGDSDTKDGESDGTVDGDKDGEEQAESLFNLTKDSGGGGLGGVGDFKPFMAGISYEAPTVQNIIQSPNTDYMAQLNKIINKGMLV